jgi:hypothetical protein
MADLPREKDSEPVANPESPPSSHAPREKKERTESQLDALRRAREVKAQRHRAVVKNGDVAESFTQYAGQGSRPTMGVQVTAETALLGGLLIAGGAAALYMAKKNNLMDFSSPSTTNPAPAPAPDSAIQPPIAPKPVATPTPPPQTPAPPLPSLTSMSFGPAYGARYGHF